MVVPGPERREALYITAKEAAAALGVSIPTLYAYVSRGQVRSVPGEQGRPRLYSLTDLDRLKTRRDARAGHGAVAAGLLMDYDTRPRVLILQSGCYDMLTLWPEAPLRTKLSILREVWPSKRVLNERSVIAHLPPRLEISVLIMHGERDNKMPVRQAMKLADALRARGAKVSTCYFPKLSHDLGKRAEPELRAFLRDNLLGVSSAAAS